LIVDGRRHPGGILAAFTIAIALVGCHKPEPSCPNSGTVCSDLLCHDTQSDPANCGECGQKCGPDEVCSAGVCGSSCKSGIGTCAADSCDQGFFNNNGTCQACSGSCPTGQYQSAACSATADRVCSTCTPIDNCPSVICTTSTDQTCNRCGSGFYQSNHGCIACSAGCPAGQYQTAACSATADRTCAACASITSCATETCTTALDQTCTACSSGFYLSHNACVSCSGACPAGQHLLSACTATADRTCTSCSNIANCSAETCTTDSDATCTACAPGFYLSGNACVGCSGACPAGEYEAAACSAAADRICWSCGPIANCTSETCTTAIDQACLSCASGFYQSGGYCHACSGACAAGQYESAACSATADRVCSSCSSIANCTSETCTTASDQSCNVCGAGFYASGGACVACSTTCPAGQYQSAACTATSDRTCSACASIANCASETCTTASNQTCTSCASNHYLNGNSCDACSTACPAGQYQSAACTATSDITCPPCAPIAGCATETCTTSTDQACTACASNYFLSGSVCTQCSTCGAGLVTATACSASADTSCTYATDCYALLQAQPTTASGVYTIDPDGPGGDAPFAAYCDMTSSGGGWTLLMKIDGSKTTFAYSAALWTNTTTYQPTQTAYDHINESKLQGFNSLAFNGMRIGLYDSADGNTRYVEAPKSMSSLQALFATNTYTPTSLGRSAWTGLVANPVLQPNCNLEGFNLDIGGGYPMKTRIGILGNQENDCNSPDSRIGIGGTADTCGSVGANISAGDVAACMPDGSTDADPGFGYVFVRNCTGGTCSCGSLTSCNALCVDVKSDAHNCGSCGISCIRANSSPTACSSGSCGPLVCNSNYGNCDGLSANGCEANLTDDSNNCGACGNKCGAGMVCSGSTCQSPNLTIINPNGATVNYGPHYPGNYGQYSGSCTSNCSVYSATGYGSGGGNAGTSAIIRINSSSGFVSGCDAYNWSGDCYITKVPATVTVN